MKTSTKATLLLLSVVGHLFFETVSAGVVKVDEPKLRNAVDAGKEIADILANGDFAKTLKSFAGLASKFLGVAGPIVSLILAFIPGGESAELKFMKEKFAEVNAKLDKLGAQFGELKREVKWDTFKIPFTEIESDIESMSTELNEFANAPDATRAANEKADFIKKYDQDYDNAAQKLYSGIVKKNWSFSSSIGDAAIEYFRRDRGKMQKFMTGTLQLLLQGMQIDQIYVAMKYPENVDYQQSIWDSRINEVTAEMKKIDDDLAVIKKSQVEDDVKDLVAENHGKSNEDLAKIVFDMLMKKYYWRWWFTVANDDIASANMWRDYTLTFCGNVGGYVKSAGKMVAWEDNNKGRANGMTTLLMAQPHIFARLLSFNDYRSDEMKEKTSSQIKNCNNVRFYGFIHDKYKPAAKYRCNGICVGRLQGYEHKIFHPTRRYWMFYYLTDH